MPEKTASNTKSGRTIAQHVGKPTRRQWVPAEDSDDDDGDVASKYAHITAIMAVTNTTTYLPP